MWMLHLVMLATATRGGGGMLDGLRTPPTVATKTRLTAAVNLGLPLQPLSQMWRRAVGSGHAALWSRADWREHLQIVVDEIGFQYVRGHGILDNAYGLRHHFCTIFHVSLQPYTAGRAVGVEGREGPQRGERRSNNTQVRGYGREVVMVMVLMTMMANMSTTRPWDVFYAVPRPIGG